MISAIRAATHALPLGAMLVGVLSATALPAAAHDFWIDGKKVDPETKRFCCGENDCHVLPRSAVRVETNGYRLLDTNELVAFSRAQPSPDGQYWVCRWGRPWTGGEQTQCFFSSELF